jgi:protein gp37
MSKIEWCNDTWNPVRGCDIVSKGCTNCYAMKQAHRFSGKGGLYEGLTKLTNGGPVWTGKVKLVPDVLDKPLHWKKPRKIFVNSMSDLFHEDIPFDFIATVFAVMSVTTRHTYQILTKRPERMLEFFKWASTDEEGYTHELSDHVADDKIFNYFPDRFGWDHKTGYDSCGPLYPYENIWLGVSVEDQQSANERIQLLLQTPAAVRWLSMEPLISGIDLTSISLARSIRNTNCLIKEIQSPNKIDWVVVGGESGNGARQCNVEWINNIVKQCKSADVPVFVKQLGKHPYFEEPGDEPEPPIAKRYLSLKNKKGGDINEFPEYLRVREYPQ